MLTTSGLFDRIRPRVETIYEDLSEAGAMMGRLLLKRISGTKPVAELQKVQTVRTVRRLRAARHLEL